MPCNYVVCLLNLVSNIKVGTEAKKLFLKCLISRSALSLIYSKFVPHLIQI